MGKRRKRRRLVLPPRPFLSGTFTFPFSRDALGRTALLSIVAFMAGFTARETLGLYANGDARMTFLGSIFTVLTVFGAVTWFAIASACALAVVGDTASGCDRIERWPGALFLDWIGESLPLVSAVGIGVGPLVGLAWLSGDRGATAQAGVAVGFFLAFPVVLLSLLENGSLVDPISLPVLRTFLVGFPGWGKFYFSTALLLLATATIAALALSAGGIPGIAVAALAASAAWLAYFRLLGRLAWYCADRTAEADRERESDDDASA